MATDARVATISPESLARPGGHYSHVRRFGDLVFTSGQLPIRPDGSHTADRPFEEQARQAIANVLGALHAAGAGPQDIIKVTVYVAGVELWPRFNAIYAEVMGEARPARTVVPVPELHYGYLVEIDAIAACPGAISPK
jgi:2-iminobutanoate/2-iminopropanoate deaminase